MNHAALDALLTKTNALAKRVDSLCSRFSARMDDANFVESEHPRGSDGKFKKYSGSKAIKNHLASVGFQQTGFSKAGKPIYEKDGIKVVIETPSDKHPWSVNWTSYKGDQKRKGQGSVSLKKALYELKYFAATPSPPAATPSSHPQKTIDKLIQHAPLATTEEKSAIYNYTGPGYADMNTSLRHGKAPSDYGSAGSIKSLKQWLDKAKLPEDVTVFRKVSGEYANLLKSIIFEGAAFQDKGFVSTSSSRNVWSGEMTFEISAKKGAKGAAVKHMSNHPEEDEILFQAGSKLKVTKILSDRICVDLFQD